MRVAAICDIHGNLPAFEAVLSDIQTEGVDAIVVGGDVLPGPMPIEVLSRLRQLDVPIRFIRGNGEVAVLNLRAGKALSFPQQTLDRIRFCAEQLTDADASEIATWPLTTVMDIAGTGRVLFCHATPRNEEEIFTEVTPKEALLPIFQDIDADLIVCGHTHMQFDLTVGSKRVVNAGSVGMPFGQQGAYWLLLGPEVEHRCTEYELVKAAAQIRATSFPGKEEFAEEMQHPPNREAVIELFTKAGVKSQA